MRNATINAKGQFPKRDFNYDLSRRDNFSFDELFQLTQKPISIEENVTSPVSNYENIFSPMSFTTDSPLKPSTLIQPESPARFVFSVLEFIDDSFQSKAKFQSSCDTR